MSPDEFVAGWTTTFNIGNEDQAQTLFTRADINDDGYIDPQDIPGIFAYFDEDGKSCLIITKDFLLRAVVFSPSQLILFCQNST